MGRVRWPDGLPIIKRLHLAVSDSGLLVYRKTRSADISLRLGLSTVNEKTIKSDYRRLGMSASSELGKMPSSELAEVV